MIRDYRKYLTFIVPFLATFVIFLIIQQLITRSGDSVDKNRNPNLSKLDIEESKNLVTQEKSEASVYDTEIEVEDKQKECSNTGKMNNDMPIQEDPTVHGVLISEFSTSERLKYLERSRQSMSDTKHSSATAPPDFFQNKIQEFVINI